MADIIVCTSGYFDPLHVGHLEYLNKSKALGNKLIVIVNNDHQAKLKKGKSFMNEKERLEIIRNLRCVDFAVLSIDKDRGMCKTLESIRPDVFTNGGDITNKICREKDACKKLGILMVDKLGEKIQSSSNLIKSNI